MTYPLASPARRDEGDIVESEREPSLPEALNGRPAWSAEPHYGIGAD